MYGVVLDPPVAPKGCIGRMGCINRVYCNCKCILYGVVLVPPVAPKGCPRARDPPKRLVLLMSIMPIGLPPDRDKANDKEGMTIKRGLCEEARIR